VRLAADPDDIRARLDAAARNDQPFRAEPSLLGLHDSPVEQPGDLLVDGNLAVARVSKEAGYASVSHFISEFRGRFGVTPGAYCDMNAMHMELDSQRLHGGGRPG
jgi:AraC-like DNA-binding protein